MNFCEETLFSKYIKCLILKATKVNKSLINSTKDNKHLFFIKQA